MTGLLVVSKTRVFDEVSQIYSPPRLFIFACDADEQNSNHILTIGAPRTLEKSIVRAPCIFLKRSPGLNGCGLYFAFRVVSAAKLGFPDVDVVFSLTGYAAK